MNIELWCLVKFQSKFLHDVIMHQSFETTPSHPPTHGLGKAGTITSYSPPCVSLGVGWTLAFTSSKSSGGGNEWTTSSHLKIRLTSSWMSRGFIFNFSVVTFLCCLVIWTFDINYFHSSCFLLLEMFFNVWWEDYFKKHWRHSRFYTGDFGLYSWVPRGGDFTQ